MEKYLPVLDRCVLFRQLGEQGVEQLFTDCRGWRVQHYQKGELVAVEGEDCLTLGIVLQGMVEVQKVFESGKAIVLMQIEPAGIFGEAIVFSNRPQYPATIEVVANSTIMFVRRETMTRWCQVSPAVLANFMGLLSNKLLLLNQKVKMLSLGSIRQKICSVLLDLHHQQHQVTVRLPGSRRMMAEQLGIPRPSLSRELAFMQSQGWIELNRDTVLLRDIAAMEQELYR